jgi:hypothetical protein
MAEITGCLVGISFMACDVSSLFSVCLVYVSRYSGTICSLFYALTYHAAVLAFCLSGWEDTLSSRILLSPFGDAVVSYTQNGLC